jgi:cell division septum initiation protein DivIVA
MDEVVELLDDVEVAMAQGRGEKWEIDEEREDAREALVELEREVKAVVKAGTGGVWAIRQLERDARTARQRFDLIERRYAARWGITATTKDTGDSTKHR